MTAAALDNTAAAARQATCPVCWAAAGVACQPTGDHAGRYRRAHRRGLITETQLAAAYLEAPVLAPASIVPAAAALSGRSSR